MGLQKSENTRDKIMGAAVDLFCRSGYDAAGVAEICSQAGVSKGAFYHHFPSKKALFIAIVDKWLEELNSQLQSFNVPGKTVPQTVMDTTDIIGSVFEVASGQLPMFMEFLVQASRDKVIWDATIAPYRAYHAYFTKLIEQGIEEGSIKPDTNAQTVAWVWIAFSVGILVQGVIMPDTADWENAVKVGMQMILSSMEKIT
jgi:TetR/AcrR family transcriptional repressor of nem operon